MLGTLGVIYARNREPHRIPLGLDPDQAVARVNKWFADVVTGLLIEIADRELSLLAAGTARLGA